MSMREITRQASVSARTDLLTGLGNRRASLDDAEDHAAALQLADHRLYEQKRSRTPSR
ncbi:hypothetical protein ACFQDE_21130 [Deinococcus caeni]